MIQRGVFAVFKPAGLTSAAVTNAIKRVLLPPSQELSVSEYRAAWRNLKVGHGGTLDKQAEGVLVIGIGEDCKRLRQFLLGDKCYECIGELGRSTDTYNTEGSITSEKPFTHIQIEDFENVLKTFQGDVMQIPPVYSAIKRGGKRLSDLARQGVCVSPPPRLVTIHSISLLSLQLPHFSLSVSCSSGTYIRSLIHDIGQKLGSAAHMVYLCRTKQGPFLEENALREHKWTVDDIGRAIALANSTVETLSEMQ